MPKAFALDISDYSIEAVELTGSFSKPKVQNWSRTTLEEGIITNGEVQNKDALKKVISKLIKNANPEPIKEKEVLISVPDGRVLTHIFNLPANLKKEQVAGIVENELENIFPISVDEVYWDFKILPNHKKKEKQEVLIAAIFRNIIDDLKDVLEGVGLKPNVFDLEANALARVLIAKGEKKSTLLLDLGAQTSKASYFDEEGINFISIINTGGEKFISKVSQKLKIKPETAFKKIKETGLGKTKSTKPTQIQTALKTDLEKIVREVKTVIKYCQAKSESSIKKITLSGGVSLLIGLPRYLKEALDLEIEIGKPVVEINTKEEKLKGPLFLGVVGLALRGLEKKFEENNINFVVAEQAEEKKVKKAQIEASLDKAGFSWKSVSKKTVLLFLLLILSLVLLGGVFWAKKNGYIGKKENANTLVAASENKQTNSSVEVSSIDLAEGLNLKINLNEEETSDIKGEAFYYSVEGEQDFPVAGDEVTSTEIETAKEEVALALLNKKKEAIKNEQTENIVIFDILDFGITEFKSSAKLGEAVEEMTIFVKADLQITLISKQEILEFINNKIKDEAKKITKADLEELNFEFENYNKKDKVLEVIVSEM